MIIKLNELIDEQKQQFIGLYYDSFVAHLDKKGKHKEKLKAIFEDAFVKKMAAAFIEDGRVAGIVACSDNQCSALKFSKDVCKQQLGSVGGVFQYNVFETFFGKPTAKTEDEGYIDYIAVHKDHRRKGIATKLLDYAYAQQNKPVYLLDVMSKNETAIALYSKLGYEKCEEKKSFMVRFVLGDTVDMMRLERGSE